MTQYDVRSEVTASLDELLERHRTMYEKTLPDVLFARNPFCNSTAKVLIHVFDAPGDVLILRSNEAAQVQSAESTVVVACQRFSCRFGVNRRVGLERDALNEGS